MTYEPTEIDEDMPDGLFKGLCWAGAIEAGLLVLVLLAWVLGPFKAGALVMLLLGSWRIAEALWRAR